MAKKGNYHIAECGMYDIEELVRAWELGGLQGFSKLIRVPSHKIGWDHTYFAQKNNNIEVQLQKSWLVFRPRRPVLPLTQSILNHENHKLYA